MNFRKDINGLRAIAVIAVVLFHFNSSWLSGGFAGVDVFFVISGFLMTGIIFKGIEQENFSLMRFYVARANRIIPALALLSFLLLVFGWFFLTPLDYKSLGKHVASSVGFLSNIIYWRESGYFDAASHEKWLLHTWSLSVEWQFYIIYPLALVAMRKFMSLKAMKTTVLVGTILGFIFCVIATYKWPDPAYYLLPTRAWEMMLGGVAYLYPMNLKDNRKKILEWFGLAFIFGSYIFISSSNPWPGYLAIIPVLGTFFIIQAQCNNSFITGNVLFQKIGAWSYSIYLWHWPIVVAIYYFSLNDTFIYIGIALSIYLGFLSHKYVEKIKFRNDFDKLFSYFKCKPVYHAFIFGVIGFFVFTTNGVESHYPDNVVIIGKESLNRNPHRCMVDNKFPCYIGNKNNIEAIIVGDSHADALTTALASSINLEKSGIIALTKSSCPFIINMLSTIDGDICQKENERRMEYLKKHYLNIPVFWVSRVGAYLYGQSNPSRIKNISKSTEPSIYFTKKYTVADESLHNEFKANLNITIAEVSINHPIFLVHPTPEMRRHIPKTLSKNIFNNINNDDDLSIDYDLYLQRNKYVRATLNEVAIFNNIGVLDPIPYLCHNNRCMAQKNGRPIYYDGDHMSEYGNKLLTPMFSLAMEDHLK